MRAGSTNWWGKLVGGVAGFAAAGPLGSILGLVLGHRFDRSLGALGAEPTGSDTRPGLGAQASFFTAVFSVMGHLCKADGRVAPEEIRAAEAVMAHMQLGAMQRRAAIALFQQGKQARFPVDAMVGQLARELRGKRDVLRVFMEIQYTAALADGALSAAERELLARIGSALGFARAELEAIEAMVRPASRGGAGPSLADACARLGVRPDSELAEVKRAYRRLLSQHHPDKLVGKGLPEEMVALANDRTREIRAAYQAILDARGV